MGFRAKRGDKVWVCYDGKLGRRQLGTVVKASQYKLCVTFVPWASDDDAPVTATFRYESWGRIWGGPGRGFGGMVTNSGWYRVRTLSWMKGYLQ
jgi:hypothetical protein